MQITLIDSSKRWKIPDTVDLTGICRTISDISYMKNGNTCISINGIEYQYYTEVNTEKQEITHYGVC